MEIELFLKMLGIALGAAIGTGVGVYKKIAGDRKKTAEVREQQFKEIDMKNHDEMLKLKFDVQYLKDESVLTKQTLEDLRDAINALNATNASLQATLAILVKDRN